MNNNHPFKWRKGFILSATFLFTLLFIGVSCKKDTNLLGGNVIDQNELLSSGGVDTFFLKTYTIEDDSVISSNPRYALLGNYNDPEFGPVNSSFYTQVRLSGLNPDFGTNPGDIVIDSFVLALEYAGSYGPVSTQTFEVYRVDQKMFIDSVYYGFSTLNIQSENLVNGSGQLKLDPSAITVIGNDTVRSQLRIPLKPSKALGIITDAINNVADFGNDESFVTNYFKGIYVKSATIGQASGTGNVAYFNLKDQDSKLTIYYSQGVQTGKSFDFKINESCPSFNHVNINNSGKYVQNVINDTISGQKQFYAQAHKSRAIVDLTTIKDLPKNIVVHSAKLYLPIEYKLNSKFTPAASIVVLNAKNLGGINGDKYSVEYSSISSEYVVDLRLFIQGYLSGTHSSSKLLISPGLFISSMERIVFNGQNTTNKKKPKLVLTYTEF